MTQKIQKTQDIIGSVKVIPVLVVEQVESAIPLAEALIEGGLPVLEVTLRTPAALEVIRLMSQVPGAIVGAGTLLTPSDVVAAKQAGALFGVSPGTTDTLLGAAEREQLPLLPGASTASEAMRLAEQGYDLLKFFPAEAAGGVPMLKSLAGPLPQLSFCPTGGVSPDNLADYLALPNVRCVGGSWIATSQHIKAQDWQAITQSAAQTVSLV